MYYDYRQRLSIQVSISKTPYKNKIETIAAIASEEEGGKLRKACGLREKISFYQTTVTSSGLLERCIDGHTFCNLFTGFPNNDKSHTYLKRDGSFTLSGKASDYFAGSYTIGIDIDKTTYESPSEYINRLSLQPTFWYTSLSHMQTDLETREFK